MTVPLQPARIVINRATRDVVLDGHTVPLTRLEFELLSLLADHAHTVLTKEEIGQRVWGYSDGSSSRAIESHFNRLRKKFNGFDPIVTKWGVGYMFAPEGRHVFVSQPADGHQSMDVVLALRPDSIIFWASPTIVNFLGATAVEVRGTNLYDHLHPSDRRHAEARRAILDTGETVELMYRVRSTRGEYRAVHARAEPMLGDDERLLSVVTVWNAASEM